MENQVNKSTLNDKIAEFVSSSRNIFIDLYIRVYISI